MNLGGIIICYSKCWSCKFGDHFEPPEWHSWADEDDIEHAKETGQADPSTSKCACACAGTRDKP